MRIAGPRNLIGAGAYSGSTFVAGPENASGTLQRIANHNFGGGMPTPTKIIYPPRPRSASDCCGIPLQRVLTFGSSRRDVTGLCAKQSHIPVPPARHAGNGGPSKESKFNSLRDVLPCFFAACDPVIRKRARRRAARSRFGFRTRMDF